MHRTILNAAVTNDHPTRKRHRRMIKNCCYQWKLWLQMYTLQLRWNNNVCLWNKARSCILQPLSCIATCSKAYYWLFFKLRKSNYKWAWNKTSFEGESGMLGQYIKTVSNCRSLPSFDFILKCSMTILNAHPHSFCDQPLVNIE